ncbi:chemotaxis protein CheX [candidate division TA06 bacterium]|nr:chemotaxis protein CheX [candidate division TA06 bacterium]
MKTRVENALKEAGLKTFEGICFMYPVPELKEIQEMLPLEAAAEVKYRGDFSGRMMIETRGGLFQAIAVNMLSSQDPTGEQKMDALGEVANIICGNVIPALGGISQGYRIEAPRCIPLNEVQNNLLGEPLVSMVFNLNQGRADLKFYVDGYYPAPEKNT